MSFPFYSFHILCVMLLLIMRLPPSVAGASMFWVVCPCVRPCKHFKSSRTWYFVNRLSEFFHIYNPMHLVWHISVLDFEFKRAEVEVMIRPNVVEKGGGVHIGGFPSGSV